MGAEDLEKSRALEEDSDSCVLLKERKKNKEGEEKAQLRQWPGWKHTVWELHKQRDIGWPIAAMNIMWFGRMVISTGFLGRLGELHLAGGTLALTFANVTAFSVLTGLSGGMEPLCAQAFGAGNHKLLGATLYRGVLLLLLAGIPIGLLWCNVDKLLLYLGQDKDISDVAGIYLRFLLPDLVATSVLAPLRIYLRSQCITKPMMVSSAVALVLHVPINMALRGLGVAGAALAICWSDYNVVLMLLFYIFKTGLHRATHHDGWWRERDNGWAPLLKLSVPTCFLTCLEWWCIEILVLVTGRLPRAEEAVSVVAIVLNGDQMLYALQIALSSCASTRVGNELGAGNAVGAYHAAVVALGLSVGVACAGAAVMISARNAWGGLFSNERGVVRGVAKLMCLMAVTEVFNFPLTVAGGVLRGTARPTVAVVMNLGAFYLVGLPMGTALAFVWKLGVLGLLVGLFVAVTVCGALTLTAVLRTDWIHHTALAQQLANSDRSPRKLSESLQLENFGCEVEAKE